MKIGNVIACIGIILAALGLISLPIYNFHYLPHTADPGSPTGSGWKIFIQTVLFSKPGFLLIGLGALFFLTAKLLPKKYWKTADDLLLDEIEKGEIKRPIRKLRLSDNLLGMCSRISAIGKDIRQILWWEVPTPTFIPTIKVDDCNITSATQ